MNTDDLEEELRRQPLRQIPAAWRTEILQAARPMRANADSERVGLTGLRLLFSCISIAGWAFAGLWTALIGIHALLIGMDQPVSESQAAIRTPNSFSVWRLNCARIEQFIDEDPLIFMEFPNGSLPGDSERPHSGCSHGSPLGTIARCST
jgi:hypothetical protein